MAGLFEYSLYISGTVACKGLDIVMQTVFVQTVFVQTVFVIKVQVNLIWPDFIRWEHIRALNQNDGLFQEVRKAKHFQTLTHKEALFLLHLQY